ncbi:hypothetical protein HK101_005107 [Irineochytrium annulatum]|nr:hypothetical protein HK101_005107 [Irineochytrium annulatum]
MSVKTLISLVAMAAGAIAAPTKSFAERDLYNRHLDTLSRVYSGALSAQKWSVLNSRSVAPGTFAPTVTGRITPFGNMNNLEDTLDYFYGTFGQTPGNPLPLFPSITAYNITAFANTGSAAHANIELTTDDFKGGNKKLRVQAMMLFAEDDASGMSQITQYDFYIVNMNAYFNELHGTLNHLSMISPTCKAQRGICGDGLSSVWPLANCEIALAFKSLGVAATISDDTILCRAAEANLAYLPGRASTHCKNLGPTGGSRCTKPDYNSYFNPPPKPYTDTPGPNEDPSVYRLFKEHAATVDNVYTLTTYPTNLGVISSGKVPRRTFSNNTYGRIWPVGTFTNTEDTVEYQFGIFGNQNKSDIASALVPVIHSFKVVAYVNTGNIAATAIDYVMLSPITNTTYPLRVQGFWRLTDNYEVAGYDVEVQNSGQFFTAVSLNIPTWLDHGALAALVCISQNVACQGENQQYGAKGQPQCLAELTSTIPLGDFNQILANSVTCRSIHVNLAFLRPQHHCPHVGPTGGLKCVDNPYDAYFDFTSSYPQPFFPY